MTIFVPEFRDEAGKPMQLKGGDKVIYREHVGFLVIHDGFSARWQPDGIGTQDSWITDFPEGRPKAVAEQVAFDYHLEAGKTHKDEHGWSWTLKKRE